MPTPEQLPTTTFSSLYNARTLPLRLGIVIASLLAAHVATMYLYWEIDPDGLRWYMVSPFDLDTEESFGTYYSSLVLLFLGRLLWHQGKRSLQKREIWATWWIVLSIGFHFLSIDEIVAIHEILNEHKSNTRLPDGSWDRWTTEGAIVAGIVAAVFLPFLWHLRWRTAIWFGVGGLIYVGGAVGIERWSDWYQDVGRIKTFEYHMCIALEEGLEMIGPVVFMHGLLGHMAGHRRGNVVERTVLEP